MALRHREATGLGQYVDIAMLDAVVAMTDISVPQPRGPEEHKKAAKLLGLDYPGGPALEALAADGDPSAVPLPRPLPGPSRRGRGR